MPPRTFKVTFTHVALPPQRPGSFDQNINNVGADLVTRMLDATDTLVSLTGQVSNEPWQTVRKTIQFCGKINEDGVVNKKPLLKAYQEVEHGVPVIIYVSEQTQAF